MEHFTEFLKTSYTAYHAVQNIAARLNAAGFVPLSEGERWSLKDGGNYYVVRGGGVIAFRYRAAGGYLIVASHTDSPCLKLKGGVLRDQTYVRLNTEPYGGGLWYTFFDRPLRLAGRTVGHDLAAAIYTGGTVVLPSLAVHMQRDANEKFSPNLQTELPLFAVGNADLPDALSYDLFAVPDDTPFFAGANGELLCSPRLDDLAGVCASLDAFLAADNSRTAVCACLDAEEIGSRTRDGAGGDLLRAVIERISAVRGEDKQQMLCDLNASFLLSLDGAHALHPNHPEKCDPCDRPVLGGGIAVKTHAGGAYTTDSLTAAAVCALFERAGVKYQKFYNRSDMRSGSTLGAISLGQVCVPSADVGVAQLAMHSAVETMARDDYGELVKGLTAFYRSSLSLAADRIQL